MAKRFQFKFRLSAGEGVEGFLLGRRVRGFLQSEPIRAARQRLGRDPGRFVPWIDQCLTALDGGRTAAAVGALQKLITQVGLPLLLVRPVAGKAILRQQGADLAAKIHDGDVGICSLIFPMEDQL